MSYLTIPFTPDALDNKISKLAVFKSEISDDNNVRFSIWLWLTHELFYSLVITTSVPLLPAYFYLCGFTKLQVASLYGFGEILWSCLGQSFLLFIASKGQRRRYLAFLSVAGSLFTAGVLMAYLTGAVSSAPTLNQNGTYNRTEQQQFSRFQFHVALPLTLLFMIFFIAMVTTKGDKRAVTNGYQYMEIALACSGVLLGTEIPFIVSTVTSETEMVAYFIKSNSVIFSLASLGVAIIYCIPPQMGVSRLKEANIKTNSNPPLSPIYLTVLVTIGLSEGLGRITAMWVAALSHNALFNSTMVHITRSITSLVIGQLLIKPLLKIIGAKSLLGLSLTCHLCYYYVLSLDIPFWLVIISQSIAGLAGSSAAATLPAFDKIQQRSEDQANMYSFTDISRRGLGRGLVTMLFVPLFQDWTPKKMFLLMARILSLFLFLYCLLHLMMIVIRRKTVQTGRAKPLAISAHEIDKLISSLDSIEEEKIE